MEMPDKCWKCDACASWQESAFSDREYWCCVKDKNVDANSKPDWCPLKPVPELIEINYGSDEQDWEKGYNSCLEGILDI